MAENLDYAPHGRDSRAELSELDIFSHVATQSDIESVHWEPVYPAEGSLEAMKKALQFTVKPSIELISLADSWMELSCSLKKVSATGELSNPGEEEKVFPTNNILYSFWKGNFENYLKSLYFLDFF